MRENYKNRERKRERESDKEERKIQHIFYITFVAIYNCILPILKSLKLRNNHIE